MFFGFLYHSTRFFFFFSVNFVPVLLIFWKNLYNESWVFGCLMAFPGGQGEVCGTRQRSMDLKWVQALEKLAKTPKIVKKRNRCSDLTSAKNATNSRRTSLNHLPGLLLATRAPNFSCLRDSRRPQAGADQGRKVHRNESRLRIRRESLTARPPRTPPTCFLTDSLVYRQFSGLNKTFRKNQFLVQPSLLLPLSPLQPSPADI